MLRKSVSIALVAAVGSLIVGCSLLNTDLPREERPRLLTLQELMPYMMQLKPQAKEALALIRATEVHKISIGAGVGVAVLDDFDDEGLDSHGFKVSAVIKAVAPGAAIYAYDLDFSRDLYSFWKEVYDYLGEIIRYKDSFGIKVINMSFGLRFESRGFAVPCTLSELSGLLPPWYPPDRNWVNMINWTKQSIEQAVEKGITVVVAAGNADLLEEFIEWQREKLYGSGQAPELPFPACMQQVITVGAVYDSDKIPEGHDADCPLERAEPQPDKPTCYTFLTETVDLLAPGSFWEIGEWTGARALEGTSFAAPTVSGVAALLLAVKDLSPKELRRILSWKGKYIPVTVLAHNWMPTTIQITRVDAWAALCEISPESCSPAPQPPASLAAQYDKNQNGKIDDDEMLVAIDDWIKKKLTDAQILQLLSCFITNRDVKSC